VYTVIGILFCHPAQSPCKNKIRGHSCEPFFSFSACPWSFSAHACWSRCFCHALYCQCHWAACFHTTVYSILLFLLTSHLLSCNACFIANGISCSKFNKIFFVNVTSSFSLPNTHITQALPNKQIRFLSKVSYYLNENAVLLTLTSLYPC